MHTTSDWLARITKTPVRQPQICKDMTQRDNRASAKLWCFCVRCTFCLWHYNWFIFTQSYGLKMFRILPTHLFTGIIVSSLGWMHGSTLIIIFVFLQVLVTGTTVPAVVASRGLYAGEITDCWLAVQPRQACTQVDSTLCLIASDTCVPRVVDRATGCRGVAARPQISASLVIRSSSLRAHPTYTGACGAKSTGIINT